MCCFSREVEAVSNTNIFVRSATKGRQYLVYSMQLKASEELAMILPLPVPPKSAEDAVRFINLEKYPEFFVDLYRGFRTKAAATRDNGAAKPDLKVVEVGSFEASFVPTVADFKRLNERFRLPEGTWDKLPAYKDYGFAVFKLKPGAQTIHPMAFEFPRAQPEQLFFPTVHIHDGEVHAEAEFDHLLYCQLAEGEELLLDWHESARPAGMFMDAKRSQDLLNPDAHCYRLRIQGLQKNEDTVLKPPEPRA